MKRLITIAVALVTASWAHAEQIVFTNDAAVWESARITIAADNNADSSLAQLGITASVLLPTVVRIELPPGEILPGDTIDAEIIIDTGADALGSYGLALDCDGTVFELTTPIWGGTTLEFSAMPIQVVSGCHANLVSFNAFSMTSPTGPVSIAKVGLHVLPDAPFGSSSVLDITVDALSDTLGQPLDFIDEDRTIVIAAQGCGNGTLDPGENCDDGNRLDGDCCASDCSLEIGACDDGDVCTFGDACNSGVCYGGEPLDCNDGNPCTEDSCNGLGNCVNLLAPGYCDDGNPCTDDSCDSASGCLNTPNSDPCDDGSVCTTQDLCVMGICLGNEPLACSDGNPCTEDSCHSTSGCIHGSTFGSCDDGLNCTINDVCSAGVCIGGPPPPCDDANPCTDDGCNEQTGLCRHLPNHDSCDDNNPCTTLDTCIAGTCTGNTQMNCNDGNPCTDDTCSPSSGCVHVDNSSACDDGNPCTIDDRCNLGSCLSGGSRNCDDGDPCTDDSCDLVFGCENVSVPDCLATTTSTTSTTMEPTLICGDVTDDGAVSAADALAVLRAAVGSGSCDLMICDVDQSGAVTALDALLVLKHAVGQTVETWCDLYVTSTTNTTTTTCCAEGGDQGAFYR